MSGLWLGAGMAADASGLDERVRKGVCHRFCVPKSLRAALENAAYRGRWAAVKGIAEENDAIMERGGFSLPTGSLQPLPSVTTQSIHCRDAVLGSHGSVAPHVFEVTDVCVANVDTVTAAVTLGDAAALSFAHAETPGGRYRHGGRAQEEDLCRLLPQLYPSLKRFADKPTETGSEAAGNAGAGGGSGGSGGGASSGGGGGASGSGAAGSGSGSGSGSGPGSGSGSGSGGGGGSGGGVGARAGSGSDACSGDRGGYPIAPGTVLVTRGLEAVRKPGTYELCASLGTCTVLTAAMPCGIADRRPKGGWLDSEWAEVVTVRIRSVLFAAASTGHANLVLGAFGCGAFGNPAKPVAQLFRLLLRSDEFRGRFRRVVFAVLDPLGTGNLRPFRQELGRAACWREGS